ncbi:alpha/beta hydrolase [Flammeovirgaceae bacterium 311]|nr:alpha/beta hydrolase [Flammeovirgaceae bacterium 311]
MTNTTTAPAWLDRSLFPFKSNFLQLKAGRMHYIDEGSGPVIIFIHGTPTWSFLYRELIKTFSKNYRCIAPDHIGFGLSDKPYDFAGTPQSHSRNLAEFIGQLGLQKFTLVVHDFGGPIGLSYAVQDPERIEGIILFNTWLWETASNKEIQKADRLLNSSLGKLLYLWLNFSPKMLLKKGFADKSKLSKEMHQHYILPFPDKDSRRSLLNIGKSLMGASGWYQQQWDVLNSISHKPWLILWGTKDRFINLDYLAKWKQRLPHAKVVELACGHFVQEEKAKESILEIQNFIHQQTDQ